MATSSTGSCHLTLIVRIEKYPDFTAGAFPLYWVM
ncbi:MAG: hypothetical protein PARBA_01275 [Parabacteroides sp.]